MDTTERQELKEEIRDSFLEIFNDFILPKMDELMEDKLDERFGGFRGEMNKKFTEHEHNLKFYIDDKLADQTSEIFKRINQRLEKDVQFKEELVVILEQEKAGTSIQVQKLKSLVK